MAAIVEEVTDDKSLAKAVRKEEQIKTASAKSPRAKLLKLADKTTNLRAVAASAPAEWSVKRRIEHVRWARDVAKGLRGVNQRLEDNLMKLPPPQSGHLNRKFILLGAKLRGAGAIRIQSLLHALWLRVAHERQIAICGHQQGFGQHPKPACQCG